MAAEVDVWEGDPDPDDEYLKLCRHNLRRKVLYFVAVFTIFMGFIYVIVSMIELQKGQQSLGEGSLKTGLMYIILGVAGLVVCCDIWRHGSYVIILNEYDVSLLPHLPIIGLGSLWFAIFYAVQWMCYAYSHPDVVSAIKLFTIVFAIYFSLSYSALKQFFS